MVVIAFKAGNLLQSLATNPWHIDGFQAQESSNLL
jgi:hypothetical protein